MGRRGRRGGALWRRAAAAGAPAAHVPARGRLGVTWRQRWRRAGRRRGRAIKVSRRGTCTLRGNFLPGVAAPAAMGGAPAPACPAPP